MHKMLYSFFYWVYCKLHKFLFKKTVDNANIEKAYGKYVGKEVTIYIGYVAIKCEFLLVKRCEATGILIAEVVKRNMCSPPHISGFTEKDSHFFVSLDKIDMVGVGVDFYDNSDR